ncbi:MAG: FAD:protein FMN transferase [Actinomycetota bacterium]
MTPATFKAMGTTLRVHGAGDPQRVRSAFARHERRFSRFLDDSELSRINGRRGRWTPVSREMAEVLASAADMRARTGGLVDIGVGEAVSRWGYDRTFAEVGEIDAFPTRSEDPRWALDGDRIFVAPQTRLDLGGIVKGWSCDRVIDAADADVVSAGGDIRSIDPTLVIEIVDGGGQRAADVEVGVGALATSSTVKRRWKVGTSEANHLIDPRTMRPTRSPIVSASVLADTAVEAEAGAKAVLLQGVDGLAWADRQAWIRKAIVIWHDGSVYANGTRMAS